MVSARSATTTTTTTLLLSLGLFLGLARAQWVQQAWSTPAYPDNVTTIQDGHTMTVSWSKNLANAAEQFCRSCNLTNVDLWYGGAGVSGLVAKGVNVKDTRKLNWRVAIQLSILDPEAAFKLMFVPAGESFNDHSGEVTSAQFWVSAPPSITTIVTKTRGHGKTATTYTTATTILPSISVGVDAGSATSTAAAAAAISSSSSASASASASATAASSTESSHVGADSEQAGLSTGLKVGIVLGTIVGAVVLVFLGFLLARIGSRRRLDGSSAHNLPEMAAGRLSHHSSWPSTTSRSSMAKRLTPTHRELASAKFATELEGSVCHYGPSELPTTYHARHVPSFDDESDILHGKM